MNFAFTTALPFSAIKTPLTFARIHNASLYIHFATHTIHSLHYTHDTMPVQTRRSKALESTTAENVTAAMSGPSAVHGPAAVNGPAVDDRAEIEVSEGEGDAGQPDANTSRKQATVTKPRLDPNALPHGLGVQATEANIKAEYEEKSPWVIENHSEAEFVSSRPVKGSRSRKAKVKIAQENGELSATVETDLKPKKAIKYGVELGVTPYPDLQHPTAEECSEVNRLLSGAHGDVKAPENIPVPSRTVAGCGEVKFVLEALIRTLLSAHTSMTNANRAIRGLLDRFPVIESGLSAGSVDWDSVRLESREELEKAIKSGGMAPTKSKAIKQILDMVFIENQTKRKELAEKAELDANASDANAKKDESAAGPSSIKVERALDEVEIAEDPLAGDTKAAIMARLANEILSSDNNILTLDYMHAMSANQAFAKFLEFPGIGIKTAACTLLFCMQRSCFAVDTHVFRLCKWLSWVPENATRDTTFAHCDVRVPNEFKYSLHQLLIVHGKSCGRCRAITGENSEAWNELCVLEELVKRTGKKKGGEDLPKSKKRKDRDETDDEDGDDDAPPKKKGKQPQRATKDTKATKATKITEATKATTTTTKNETAAPKRKRGADNTKTTEDADEAAAPPPKKTRQTRSTAAAKNAATTTSSSATADEAGPRRSRRVRKPSKLVLEAMAGLST